MNPTRNREGVLSREGDRRRSPLLTVCVLVATSAVSIGGFVYHGVLDALEREPGVLARDEWWRLLTPLLVHDGDWPHLAANAAALVVVGVSVERAFGRPLWLALYLAGGLAGELAGYAWQPRGAGNSVAVCGLAGGLLAALLLRREAKVSAIGAVFVPYWVAALVAYASDSLVVGVGLCVLVAPLGFLVLRNGLSRPLAVFVGSAGVLGALTLLALHDIHGAALLAGALVGGAGILRRNPWSSMDVQREGGDAFRAAQAAYAEDIAKERAEAERERDFEAFRKTFVAEGGIGDEKVIRAAFETARAEQATQQAVAAEREGLLGERYRLGSLL